MAQFALGHSRLVVEHKGEQGDSAVAARREMSGVNKQGFHCFRLQRYAIFWNLEMENCLFFRGERKWAEWES